MRSLTVLLLCGAMMPLASFAKSDMIEHRGVTFKIDGVPPDWVKRDDFRHEIAAGKSYGDKDDSFTLSFMLRDGPKGVTPIDFLLSGAKAVKEACKHGFATNAISPKLFPRAEADVIGVLNCAEKASANTSASILYFVKMTSAETAAIVIVGGSKYPLSLSDTEKAVIEVTKSLAFKSSK